MPIIVDKQKKRRDIIEAAVTVFSRVGYRRAKIKDIADEAHMGKGTVYEYFRSKQELFLQVCESLFAQYIEDQKKNLKLVSSSDEQLRAFISSTFEQAAMWTDFAYVTIDIWAEMGRRGEQDTLRQLMSEMVERIIEVVAPVIREGQARGEFEDFDARLTARTILASMDGLVLQLLIKGDAFDPNTMADTLADVILRGLSRKNMNR